MINTLIEKIRGEGTHTASTEGSDPCILEATVRLHKENIVVPVLLGNRVEVTGSTAANGWDIEGTGALGPTEYKNMDMMVTKMIELRKDKLDEAQTRGACLHRSLFGTVYVKFDCAGDLLDGAAYSTTGTVRPALQLIKTRPGDSIVSSCSILMKDDEESLVMGDCSINIDSGASDLVETALQAIHAVRQFGIEPRVGLLSYFTLGSVRGTNIAKVNGAATRLKRMPLNFVVENEVWSDCAVAPEVAKLGASSSEVAGNINTFIFPDIDAGNIGYKIASRLGGYEAIGPILQDLNTPINDLFRGCSAEEVFKIAMITATQKHMDI